MPRGQMLAGLGKNVLTRMSSAILKLQPEQQIIRPLKPTPSSQLCSSAANQAS